MRARKEDTVSRARSGREEESQPCAHLTAQPLTPLPVGFEPYCADCAFTGDQWVNLRRCLTCDHVACCDESINSHATRHFKETGHEVMTSVEPGETWRWCFIDEETA